MDVETTGLDPKINGVIQIALIAEIDGEVQDEVTWKVKPYPTDKVEEKALQVSGVTSDELATFADPKDILGAMRIFLGKFVEQYDRTDKFTPVGYNVRFDMDFLKAWFEKGGDKYFGSWFCWQSVDPLALCYWLRYTGKLILPDYKLTTVCEHFGVALGDAAHDALADIRATRELTKLLVAEYLQPKR
jgi:DNA polymerase III epsilon subunit-like protein